MLGVAVPMLAVSLFWGFVGLIGPLLVTFLVPQHCDRGLIRTMLVLTAVCCYVFWLITYLCQLNPLIGPRITSKIIVAMQREWK